MTNYTTKEYKEILSKLPQEIRDKVSSYDTVEALWKIGESHKLHVDQIGAMNNVALDVMMGITASKDFVEELSKAIGVSRLEANLISSSIDEELFKPIKELMKKTYGDSAPFKLKTLQRIDEKEEHPDELHKDEILKAIEDPEIVNLSKRESNDKNTDNTHTIEKTPEVEKNDIKKEDDVVQKEDEIVPQIRESRERLLNLISSKKLDSVVTMAAHQAILERERPTLPQNPVNQTVVNDDLSEKKNELNNTFTIAPFGQSISIKKDIEMPNQQTTDTRENLEGKSVLPHIVDPYREAL